MDFSTSYLGLRLQSPLLVGASPLVKDLEQVKRLAEAGVGAVVMYSLFEEQINHEKQELNHFLTAGTESFAEALSYFPQPEEYSNLGAQDYLEQIRKVKAAAQIPVIASLNGVSEGGWMDYARHMQDAGADALELNVYYVPTSPKLTAANVEDIYISSVKAVKQAVSIPVALKVGPFFSSFANFAAQVDQAGVDGLVLFNRFYGPEIDLEELEVVPKLRLSTDAELPLPLRWVAVLFGRIKADLAATSGVHEATDVIKLIMAGANVVQMVSALLKRGPGHAAGVLAEMKAWLEKHEYESIDQMRGSMSYQRVVEPAAYERANYMKTLQSWE